VKISIIVPAFNEERLLGQSLEHIKASAAAFATRAWESELIVCNNNSTDQTPAIAQAAGAQVIFEPINQIARARNAGAAAASGDWLLFIDADSHPTPELFSDVADQIQSGKCLAGGATVRLEGDYPLARRIIGVWNSISRVCRLMAGSFIFCQTQAFREIGGFSKELFASEEIDLSKRLKKLARKRGKKIVILTRHPLLTSARKLHLYSVREHLRVILRMTFSGGRSLTKREACHTWYDGRR
jgi:glycosyltransferase involved in cell wall biosynthesis